MGTKRSFTIVLALWSLLATTVVMISAPAAQALEASFRASAEFNGNTPNPSVVVPAAVQSGDELVMVVTVNTALTIPTPGLTSSNESSDVVSISPCSAGHVYQTSNVPCNRCSLFVQLTNPSTNKEHVTNCHVKSRHR